MSTAKGRLHMLQTETTKKTTANNTLETNNYTLGIDMGVASIGYAIIDETTKKIIHLGTRCFPSPATNTDNNAATRRLARAQRRNTARKVMRRHKLFTYLQTLSLLPPFTQTQLEMLNAPMPTEFCTVASKRREMVRRYAQLRNSIITSLDAKLFKEWLSFLEHRPHYAKTYLKKLPNIFPYFLRSIALDEQIDRYSLGRIIYYFGQRKGFLSNRKNLAKELEDEKKNKINSAVNSLEVQIQKNQCRTLGEYLAKYVDINKETIRKRYTARSMYTYEYNLIISSQNNLVNKIKNEFDDKSIFDTIYKILFYQRPLKSVKKLIGGCELEEVLCGKTNIKRAKKCLLTSQQFRIWQNINNLKIVSTSNESIERELTLKEKNCIFDICQKNNEVSLVTLAKNLNLNNEKFKNDMYFNKTKKKGESQVTQIERKIIGNKTLSKIAGAYKKIFELSKLEQEKIINAILSFDNTEILTKYFIEKKSIPELDAQKLAKVYLEDGYLSYSTKAIKKLLPHMQNGKLLHEAIELAGYTNSKNNKINDLLPAYVTINKYSNNPAVLRSLSQLRLVVNAIIKKYGKPKIIRVELARDLKSSQKEKIKNFNQNKANKDENERIKKELTKKNINVSASNIEKFKLWQECNFQCPYTGYCIGFDDLFGGNPTFDVEHIIPLSRSCNDFFANKTLCRNDKNRNKKQNHTPFEAYSITDPDEYEKILKRVEKFNSPYKYKKLSLFKAQNIDKEFSSRMLNDTRYASKLATQYLGLLYGGIVDSEGNMRVRVSSGQVTAILRNNWKLNKLLSQENAKTRLDHRHHAIDALVIALTNERAIQLINKSASRGDFKYENRFSNIEIIWPDLLEQTKKYLNKMLISFYVSPKINALLHEETILSKKNENFYYRKNINEIKSYINNTDKYDKFVLDPALTNIIKNKYNENILSQTKITNTNTVIFDQTKIDTLPYLTVKNSSNKTSPFAKEANDKIYVKSFRNKTDNTENSVLEIGTGIQKRYVAKNYYHHISVFSTNKKDIHDIIFSKYLDVIKRKKSGQCIIVKKHHNDPEAKFLFYLKKSDIFEIEENGVKQYYIIIGFEADNRIKYSHIYDAQKKPTRKSINNLLKMKFKKLKISPLGEILQ